MQLNLVNGDEEWAEMLFLHLSDVDGVWYGYPSKDFSFIDLTINMGQANEETHTVELFYNYDKKILKKLQGFINNFPDDIENFYVRDLELINYWINNVKNDDSEHLDAYSGELKSYINNSNIEYYVDNRAGDAGNFFIERLGIATFRYNDIIYYVDPYLGTRAENIIYVPNETGNTKEELIKAAQKRIDEYLGEEGIAKVSYAGTIYDVWLKDIYEATRENWEEKNPNMTFEEFKLYGYNYIPAYEKFEEVIGIKNVNKNDDSFVVTIKVGNKEKSFNIIIRKDTSKMITPTYASADIITDIEINSAASSIPLDTSIQVEKITSGTEYERIIKILDLKENEMVDLKLYSDSLENYFTKLSNGEFEVRIPISEKFKGKNLIVYYVDEKGNVKEHDVTVKEGFAIFTTKHFSIYTLAEKVNETYKVVFDANGGMFGNEKNTLTFEEWNTGDEEKLENPTREGYKFLGYFTKKIGGNSLEKYIAEVGIDANLTFYAQWEKINDDDKDNMESAIGNSNMNDITDNSNNPETGDNIMLFISILAISILGIVITLKVKKVMQNNL